MQKNAILEGAKKGAKKVPFGTIKGVVFWTRLWHL